MGEVDNNAEEGLGSANVKPVAMIKLFSGSDAVTLDDAVRKAAKEALGGQPADFALAELTEADYQEEDGTYTISPLVDAAQTAPMLTDRRVVIGRHLARFSTQDSVAALVQYLQDPLETTHLILVWDKGPANTKRTSAVPKKLKEALTAHGVQVEKTDIDSKNAPAYIDKQLAHVGVNLDPQARRTLGQHLGDDTNRVVGIARALFSAHGTNTVGVDDLAPFLGSLGSVPPWELTDTIASGNIGAAIDICRRIVHGGERHPLAVMATLVTHYSRMASLDGAPVATDRQAAQYLGTKGSTYPLKKAMQQARRMGSHKVKESWALLATADLDLRGATANNPEAVLELLVARLTRLCR